ncbi:hypothetical protein GUITHDRAFT_156675, partial [Guillardia theta CCMP2712]
MDTGPFKAAKDAYVAAASSYTRWLFGGGGGGAGRNLTKMSNNLYAEAKTTRRGRK